MRKHPNQLFRRKIEMLRDPEKKKQFYKNQENRKISWPEYNLSKIMEIKEELIFIRNSVNKVKFEIKKSVGRPPIKPKNLAKAILFCEAVGLPERQAQGWLEIISPFLGIHEKLDDRVIGEAYYNPNVIMILNQVFEENKSSNSILQGDGSGLERSRKENYEKEKDKNEGRYMISIVDTREIVQSFDISSVSECKVMKELINDVKGERISLDSGFVDRELIKKISLMEMTPYVFPKKNNNMNGDPYWQKMCYDFYLNTLNWLINYHQRNHTESFHSSFKRVFGIVTKLRFSCKFTQVCARIILHNHRRLCYFKRL
jgi:transposase